jgi:hypothetical protein
VALCGETTVAGRPTQTGRIRTQTFIQPLG